jgi:hypothetical protein
MLVKPSGLQISVILAIIFLFFFAGDSRTRTEPTPEGLFQQNLVAQKYPPSPPPVSPTPRPPALPSQLSKNGCPKPGLLPKLPITPAKITSQIRQDGVIRSFFAAVKPVTKYFVEFGFVTPTYEDQHSGSNTRQLKEAGWKGLLLDGNNENPQINLHRHFITPENIVSLFQNYSVPFDLDYLSVDIDSLDLWVLRRILQSNYRPTLVSIEYNSNFPAHSCAAISEPGPLWNGTKRYGCSLASVADLAEEQGYGIVWVEDFVDVFLARCDVLAKAGYSPWAKEDWKNATCLPLHLAMSRGEIGQFWDFCEWRARGAEEGGEEAIKAAKEKAKKDMEKETSVSCVKLVGDGSQSVEDMLKDGVRFPDDAFRIDQEMWER